jgi:Zn-dependent protease
MRGSIAIGRLAGVPIAMHPSWLLVVGLLTWRLAVAELPGISGGWSLTAYWAAGVLTSLVAFASVLLHVGIVSREQLVHSVSARAELGA